MIDDWIVPIFIILVIVLGVFGLAGAINYLEKLSCREQAEFMGFDYDYSFIKGCYISVENKWIPLESYWYEGRK